MPELQESPRLTDPYLFQGIYKQVSVTSAYEYTLLQLCELFAKALLGVFRSNSNFRKQKYISCYSTAFRTGHLLFLHGGKEISFIKENWLLRTSMAIHDL